MLKYKKINKKKLIISIIIIVLMFGGTGFFIYKNYTLTSHKKSIEYNNIFELESFSNLNSNGKDIESAEAVVNKNGDIMDMGIFNDPKFKALKDNTVKWEEAETGRENPFEPY